MTFKIYIYFIPYILLNILQISNFINIITIRSNSVVSYLDMFRWTAYQAGSRVVVNYTSSTSALVDKMIATKVNNSNVVKGSLVQ